MIKIVFIALYANDDGDGACAQGPLTYSTQVPTGLGRSSSSTVALDAISLSVLYHQSRWRAEQEEIVEVTAETLTRNCTVSLSLSGGTFALYSLISRYAKVCLIPNQQAEDELVSRYRHASRQAVGDAEESSVDEGPARDEQGRKDLPLLPHHPRDSAGHQRLHANSSDIRYVYILSTNGYVCLCVQFMIDCSCSYMALIWTMA